MLTPLNPQLALKVLCADPIVAAVASPEDCVYAAPPRTPEIAAVVTVENQPTAEAPPTKEEVNEAIDRAFKKAVSK